MLAIKRKLMVRFLIKYIYICLVFLFIIISRPLYATVIPSASPSISGFIFNDNGQGGAIATNGIKEGGETGIGIAVPVIAYNEITGLCYATLSDPTTGAYQLPVGGAGTYKVYEAAKETDINNPTCSPSKPVLDKNLGGYVLGTIGDPPNIHSSSANIVTVNLDPGTAVSDVNFGDFEYTPYPVCSPEAFLLRNNPTDEVSVDLVTGVITPRNNDVLPRNVGVFGGSGYNLTTATIFGDNINDRNTVLMLDGNGDAFVFPILNGTMNTRNINSGDVDNDGLLLIANNRGSSLYKIDVNPNSETYLTQVDEIAINAPRMHDIALNPIDDKLYTLTIFGDLIRIDPNTGARTELGKVGSAGESTVAWGAVYFDEKGFFYASQNPGPGRIVRIDLSNPNLPAGSYVANNFTQLNASTSQNDGARCRYASFALDWGDAPNSYGADLASAGPRHEINSSTPYLGVNLPDSEDDGQPSTAANGDDIAGLSADDEDGFIQPTISTLLTDGDILPVSVQVTSSGNDTLYGWIDFDNDGVFSSDERANVNVTASGTSILNFTVPPDVEIVETFIRLRICSSSTTCSLPTESAGDGEVEDHLISLKPPGDLALTLDIAPSLDVTLGIPFNVIVRIENTGTTPALNTKVNFPIPTGYSFVKAYENDGVTQTNAYDPVTAELDVGTIELGLNDYAVIRLAPQSLSASHIDAEILETSIIDTDSTPNNGFNNGEDDTDRVTPNVTNDLQPGICEAPSMYEGGDAFLSTNGEYIVTTNAQNQSGYLWSYEYIDLNQPMYAELAVYLGDRNLNTGGPAGEFGADGMTFILSADPRGLNAIGAYGGGLGVDNIVAGTSRISPSVVVEFDTYDNAFSGATDDAVGGQYIDHTAIYLNGNVYSPTPANTLIPATSVSGGELEDGRYHIAQFEWDPNTNQFSYYLDGVLIGQITRDIRTDLGTNVVRFGFTGSTGDAFNLQKGCFTNSPNALGADMGDAPDTSLATAFNDYTTTYANNGPQHVQIDSNNNNLVDLRLGQLWDTDLGDLQNIRATADDEENIADEDGVIFPAVAMKGETINVRVVVTEDAGRTSTGQQVFGWLDFNLDGDWDDAGEKIISDTSASIGNNDYSISIPANITAGHSYLRVRLCSDADCDSPTGVASDGEVEDYRILLLDLIDNNQCDLIVQTSQTSGGAEYAYMSLDTPSALISFSDIVNPINITNQINVANINAIGFNRVDGLVYGTFTNTAQNTYHLFVTDKAGTNFIDLGEIQAASISSLKRLQDGQTFSFNQYDALKNTGYSSTSATLSAPSAGDISADGNTLIIWDPSWDSLIKVDLRSQLFTLVPLNISAMGGSYGSGPINVGEDLTISNQSGEGYLLDLEGDYLYEVNITTGAVSAQNLTYLGDEPSIDDNGLLQANALVIDDGINLYAFTQGGSHDTDNDSVIDLENQSVMYRINIITKEVEYVSQSDQGNIIGNDGAGCYDSNDYGDAALSYGQASHGFFDSEANGVTDLFLGSRWDPEFAQWSSSDASGDDVNGQDDEDLNLPSQIIVETNTNLPLNVVGDGFVSVWADLNNDGDFADPNELLVNDTAVITGTNNVAITLNAASAEGFNGNTVMRIRLCSTANTCNTFDGAAVDGEVEDHWFELLNRIVLTGTVFEDNGQGGATAAHDGVQEGTESGLGKIAVNLIFNDTGVTGFSAGDVINTQTTSGDGQYQFVVGVDFSGKELLLKPVQQAQLIDISEADVTAIAGVTSSSVIDSQMVINASVGDVITDLDFGKVKAPRMETDNFSEIEPGQVVFFVHKFTSATQGVVDFSIINQVASPANTGWSATLYQDDNCDGEINGTDTQISTSVAVSGNTEVCLISRVFVPADATLNAQYSYDISANMVFSDTQNTGHGITRTLFDSDTVRATFAGAGTLFLEKTVRNVTQSGVVGVSNQAVPGDVLEYTIHFSNPGLGNISEIDIFDNTPEYTSLSTEIDCTDGVIPTSLSCTPLTPNGVNAPGYEGEVRWEVTGTLLPGEQGSVVYFVKVE